MARVFGLDLVRALAIWGVLLSHGNGLLIGDKRTNVVFTVGGTWGVQAFFVLSGFLIGGILLRELGRPRPSHHAALGFLLRRWFRTLPMYYAALLVYIAVAWLVSAGTAGLGWRHIVFLQNAAGPPQFMGVSWSLTIEEWFYFMVAATLFALGGFRGTGRRLVAVALVLIAVSTGGRWAMVLDGAGWEHMRKLLWFNFDGIAVGVLAAYAQRRYPERWHRVRWPAAAVGSAILGAAFGSLAALRHTPGLDQASWAWYHVHWFQVASIGVALLIPGLAAWKTSNGALATGIAHVSLVSYSMYLLHMPIRAVFLAAGLSVWLPRGASWSLWVVVVVACSTISYRVVEEPFLRLRDRSGMPWTPLTKPHAGMAPMPAP